MANNQKVTVVALPSPVQGHLTPFLHLSRRIAACDVPVYFVSPETALEQATVAISHGWDPSATANLHLHGYPTTSDPNVWDMKDATAMKGFEESVSSLLTKLASENHTRVVFIFDAMLTCPVQPFHSLPNVESYAFESCSAFTSHCAILKDNRKPGLPPDAAAERVWVQHSSTEGCLYEPYLRELLSPQFYEIRDKYSGIILNTTRLPAEVFYLDLLAKLPPRRVWAIGPLSLNPVVAHARSIINSECLDWLDKKPANSVLLVSFGTRSPLSDEQMREIAIGLETSEVGFVWLLRDADHIFEDGGETDNLLQGFEERVSERGIVVREWGAELEILEHRATGGLLSHCEWNSCMECISRGVPVVAWPLNADEDRNALLMTTSLKVGVEVERSQKDELVASSTLAEVVRRLMVPAEGAEMRQRAEQLEKMVKDSMMDDGATPRELASFIAHITRN